MTAQFHGKIVVTYINAQAEYRQGDGKFNISDLDPNLCTHIIYAFAGINDQLTGIKSLDPHLDLKENGGRGLYEEVTKLKKYYAHLKISLSIGGWNEQTTKNFSLMSADSAKRSKFISQARSFIKQYNFDGLDLSWLYPTQPDDRKHFLTLCKELRRHFNTDGLILTSTIGAGIDTIDRAYDIPKLSCYLNFFHVLCYDYHGKWDGKIDYHSPLRAQDGDPLCVQYTIDYLLKLGAPASKLVLGLPFYGRTYETRGHGNIGDTIESSGFQGSYTRENGSLSFYEICLELKNEEWKTHWDSKASQVLAHRTNGQITKVINFDSSRSIANKMKFVISKKLAGVAVWTVDNDDFKGTFLSKDCDEVEHSLLNEVDTFKDFARCQEENIEHSSYINFPLLRTIKDAIPLALLET